MTILVTLSEEEIFRAKEKARIETANYANSPGPNGNGNKFSYHTVGALGEFAFAKLIGGIVTPGFSHYDVAANGKLYEVKSWRENCWHWGGRAITAQQLPYKMGADILVWCMLEDNNDSNVYIQGWNTPTELNAVMPRLSPKEYVRYPKMNHQLKIEEMHDPITLLDMWWSDDDMWWSDEK